jgi:hypothetical protein
MADAWSILGGLSQQHRSEYWPPVPPLPHRARTVHQRAERVFASRGSAWTTSSWSLKWIVEGAPSGRSPDCDIQS